MAKKNQDRKMVKEVKDVLDNAIITLDDTLLVETSIEETEEIAEENIEEPTNIEVNESVLEESLLIDTDKLAKDLEEIKQEIFEEKIEPKKEEEVVEEVKCEVKKENTPKTNKTRNLWTSWNGQVLNY